MGRSVVGAHERSAATPGALAAAIDAVLADDQMRRGRQDTRGGSRQPTLGLPRLRCSRRSS